MKNIRYLQVGILAVIGWVACAGAYADDLVRPDPSIAPAEVVAIQLMGLKNNDLVETDFGIRQTWSFAHPKNRNVTGPFPRFAQMLKGPGYDMMLNHASHQIVPANSGDGWRQFDVFMEAGNGKVLAFAWIVEKVTKGRYKDCWMTVAVSAPRPAGQGS